MSSYFDRVEQSLCEAVDRRSRSPWYQRLLGLGRTRSLAVVLAALVITTPAVGAVSGWFSFGKPNTTPRLPANSVFGVVKPGESRLLSIRAADPQGGPAWGLRLVRTNRGNTCLQLGRVESGHLGSLGIDDAWNNDHKFHTISPNAAYADACGSTDAAGHGYVNLAALSESASANPTYDATRGPQSRGCKLRDIGGPASWRYCPPGSNRMVFYGLLGPDATSITYRRPDGTAATERTAGGVGAYLIVFQYDRAACSDYSEDPFESTGCNGIRVFGVSPGQLGAVTKLTYRDGHSCSIDPPARLVAAYLAFNRRIKALPELPTQKQRYARYGRQWSAFLGHEHLTAKQFADAIRPPCPAVGWVPFSRTTTRSDVATSIHVHVFPAGTYACPKNPLHLPDGCNYPNMSHGIKLRPNKVVPVEWSFTARRPVTTSNSWYSWRLQYPPGARCGGSQGSETGTKVSTGQTLRYSAFLNPKCSGTYRLTVGYMPAAPPGVVQPGGGAAILTGRDGSRVVGRTSFTIR